jgi:hypothetical protein
MFAFPQSNQASRFFSRRLHRADWLHSKTATTLLIGRGYRLRDRSASQIQHGKNAFVFNVSRLIHVV